MTARQCTPDTERTARELTQAVRQALGLHRELAVLVSIELWRTMAGRTVPPFDQAAAIRAALAADVTPERAAEHFGLPVPVLMAIAKRARQ
ncbi:hypothetical protein [uncultured Thiohalocapsa sp.]|uniref:hypothetical protein n=1 Tax=uncultured Thiohalocapsa sp. TaxID=768990 RepID=UPI0025E313A4|nr:hypothetical protein [uncultured Thiohalocapsa sp.]